MLILILPTGIRPPWNQLNFAKILKKTLIM